MKVKLNYYHKTLKNPQFDVTFSSGYLKYDESFSKSELIDLAFDLLNIADVDEKFNDLLQYKIKSEFNTIYSNIKDEAIEEYESD